MRVRGRKDEKDRKIARVKERERQKDSEGERERKK